MVLQGVIFLLAGAGLVIGGLLAGGASVVGLVSAGVALLLTGGAFIAAGRGAQARSIVLDIEDTRVRVNHQPRLAITVQVQQPSGAPFHITRTFTLPQWQVPRVGEQVLVWYDPRNPNNFVFGTGPAVADAAVASPDSSGRSSAGGQG